MNNLQIVTINNTDISVKEYQDKRVVTLKEIDQCHGRPDGTAKRNFQQNKQHLIDGIDYFTVKPSDVQKNEFRTFEIPNRGLTLITESGYLMLVKSFTDDLAWDVQRQLVNSYFKVTKSQPNSETAKMRAEAMLLNAKNRTAKQMLKLWSDAGIKPQYQALSLNNYYDGLEIPRIAFKDEVTALYDATTIASHLGVMSKSGKPHAQAIGAIIEKLKPLEANEWAMTPYSRNGHDDESIQYAISVEKKVADWLIENNYPTVIKNKCKNFSVLYKERSNTP